ncbi:DNA ligase [Vibrio marisflavi]|uniref:DNA ligase n=1 Tax=Vibrio marisflavi CECT 7928 TaxID=634439 RepID=A0ABM9A594_9VIBR|nr:DNA ligase [Vibrio marisflavi]CAH0539909.1 DNA ligase [Vibrio marisflavi CECT 7928]
MTIKVSLLALSISMSFSASSQSMTDVARAPEIVTTARSYSGNIKMQKYWYSEKLDGIRAIWTGTELKTRKGNIIHAPSWFTKSLPNIALDGELWAGRQNYYIVQNTVLDQTPNDEMWRSIRYMVFDLPNHKGNYQQRYARLKSLVKEIEEEHVAYVPQYSVQTEQQLYAQLTNVIERGGEGLMLREVTALYHQGRSDSLLKLKQASDDEATVIGYKAGSGKYQGMMGALLVRMQSGIEFYIGSGFSDKLRESPPPIGSRVMFKFNGYTHKGIPKFARYVRERP